MLQISRFISVFVVVPGDSFDGHPGPFTLEQLREREIKPCPHETVHADQGDQVSQFESKKKNKEYTIPKI